MKRFEKEKFTRVRDIIIYFDPEYYEIKVQESRGSNKIIGSGSSYGTNILYFDYNVVCFSYDISLDRLHITAVPELPY